MLIFRECRVEKRRADEEGFYKADDYIAHCLFSENVELRKRRAEEEGFYKADDYIAHCLFSENVELRKGELTRKGFIKLMIILHIAYFRRT